MAKATHDYEAIGKAFVLLASLLGGSAAVPQSSTTSTPASKPDEPKPDTTPAAPKADANEGNSKGLDAAAFSKLGMQFAKDMGDKGAKAKELFGQHKAADGSPVATFSQVQAKDYDGFIALMDEALEEKNLAG